MPSFRPEFASSLRAVITQILYEHIVINIILVSHFKGKLTEKQQNL